MRAGYAMVVYPAEMDVAELGELSLQDANGTEHRLADLWADRRVVLVFLRHFG